MLPEQIWDEADRPEWGMYFGRPAGAAMPLMWAHAEYIKLLRSVQDGAVFDRLSPVKGSGALHILLAKRGTLGGKRFFSGDIKAGSCRLKVGPQAS